jgi:CRISPR/Cas system-associated exonuclease Cas4 (RecB family)
MSLISYPFSAILGWSASRHEAFAFCKRQYYYQYYSKFDVEYPVAKIQALKMLTNRALAVGSLSHLGIEALLKRLEKSTAPIESERFALFLNQLSETFVQNNTFEEAHYGSNPAPTAKELTEATQEYLDLFLKSERYKWICALPEPTRKAWMIEPGGFGETRINNLKAYCKVDFLLQHKGKTYIFDWKTGKVDPEKHARQMLGYALFAHTNLGVGFEHIELILHYLSGSETTVDLNAEDLPNFEAKVQADTQEMYAYCEQVDTNIPKPKEAFPMIEPQKLCSYCKFRELCGRE